MEPRIYKIFCYGTLKSNHPRSMTASYPTAKFLTEFTLRDHTLYKMPFRDAPVMVPYLGEFVIGEIYAVDQSTLDELDKREGVHTGWYTREYIKELDVYVYMWKHSVVFFKHIGPIFFHRKKRGILQWLIK
ncbi:MAG TPA: gamma-glutamylcyclotransferase family protein [Patescibacteria group bacterium]|nr:gamma-glutamylcyclotransferase family protein [Patescibacteria group bacterium]